jgi:hypothetical protein
MKKTFLLVASLACGLSFALGQAKTLSNDPLTALPLSPATDAGKNFGNEPNKMRDSQLCKSKMQGNFYLLYKIKVSDAVSWYSSHLSGFKKIQGYESGRSQVAFMNSDGTMVIFITGTPGAQGQDTDAYSVAYEKYQPGISAKTIESMSLGKLACQ